MGTISGENTETENIKFVESVKHGENSTINIEMKPFSNYKVDKIIINNEEYNDFTENEYGNVILDTFKNVIEDIHIQVIFERKAPFVLTKKNEEGDILPGAKFTISKITSQDDNTIEEPAKDIDGNILGSLKNINGNELYVIEVNPRASRTVPYISKVTGVPMVALATRCELGEKLADMGYGTGLYPEGQYHADKLPVFT